MKPTQRIFATRIRRLPLFQWLLTLLQVVDEPYLSWEDALTALEVEFPPADVARQLEIIVRWGRYAEILAYDDTTGRISLERASEAPVAT
jgi:NitT/TauT family transport system ATP-binding protein